MSNELEKLLDEIQAKTLMTMEEISAKIGYSRPYLNDAKKKGGNRKLIAIVKEKFASTLSKEEGQIGISTDKESMAKEIIHLKAVVKAQGDLLVKLVAGYYGRSVQDVMKELRDNTSLIIMDQGDK